MRRVNTAVLALAASSALLVGCSSHDGGATNDGGSAEATDSGQENVAEDEATVSATLEQPDPEACDREVSINALQDKMPEFFAQLPHDPNYSVDMDGGWEKFFKDGTGQWQYSVGAAYLEEGDAYSTCPDEPQRAADDFRTVLAEDYQRQQRENGEVVVPFDDLEFTVEGRYFACAKNPPADLRQFFCTTNMGNAMVTTYMFRHSKGDEADIADMKAAMAELTPIVDDVPIGPGLSDI